MNEHSKKRLSQVHPELSRRAVLIMERLKQQGITVEVVQGFRSAAEQNELYAQGRTKPGRIVTNAKAWQSNHSYGLAVDLCVFTNGKPNWEAPYKKWEAIGIEAERLGLEWGGRWKSIRDLPHVQLNGLSISQCRRLYEQGGLALVWQRASAALRAVESSDADLVINNQPDPNILVTKPEKGEPDAISSSRPRVINSPAPNVGNYPITFPAATTSAAARVEAAQPRPQTTLPPRPRHVEEVTAKVGIAGGVLTVLVAAWEWLVVHRWWALAVWVTLCFVWQVWKRQGDQ